MKDISIKPTGKVSFAINLELTVNEAKVLNAIAGYGTDSFLEIFYKGLGKAYLADYEEELRDLFDKFKNVLPSVIAKVEEAESDVNDIIRKFNS